VLERLGGEPVETRRRKRPGRLGSTMLTIR
jgi:hypothetical protein